MVHGDEVGEKILSEYLVLILETLLSYCLLLLARGSVSIPLSLPSEESSFAPYTPNVRLRLRKRASSSTPGSR